MKPEPTALYPTDDCIMIEGFTENYQLCNLARDESFGWPLQDPDLDSDPFNLPANHGLDFVFDPVVEGPRDWVQSWPIKAEPNPVPECAWQQLALKLTSPALPSRPTPESTSLTPVLVALDLPKGEPLPDDYAILGSCRRQEFPEKREEHSYALGTYLGEYAEYCNEFQYEDPEHGVVGDVITIGSYTQSERALKLLHYRQKRARRNFSKRVLYGCRKEFADSRPRVGGRFVIDENRVIKPKTFLKRGRPRKVALPLVNYLATGLISN